jgi:hypothetical protein
MVMFLQATPMHNKTMRNKKRLKKKCSVQGMNKPLIDPLPETCTLLRVYSPKVKDGFYASQHPVLPD